MDIRRGEHIRHDTDEMITFCLTQIEEHGFSDNVEWGTKISQNVTVEELIGALVAAENKLEGKD